MGIGYKEIDLGIDVVLAVLRRDYRNNSETLDRVEEELKAYFQSCHEADLRLRNDRNKI